MNGWIDTILNIYIIYSTVTSTLTGVAGGWGGNLYHPVVGGLPLLYYV